MKNYSCSPSLKLVNKINYNNFLNSNSKLLLQNNTWKVKSKKMWLNVNDSLNLRKLITD